MATIESLPLELILPIVKDAVNNPWSSEYNNKALLALSRISPPFRLSAQTLLHEVINFKDDSRAEIWLLHRDRRLVVKQLRLASLRNAETALAVVQACSPELVSLYMAQADLYSHLIHESNLESQFSYFRSPDLLVSPSLIAVATLDIKELSLGFIPSQSPHALSFRSLRELTISHAYYLPPPSLDGVVQLLQSTIELTSLRFSKFTIADSEIGFANAFRRIAVNLTTLHIEFGHILKDTPLSTIFGQCSSLKTLSIIVPNLKSLHQLLSHLPATTVTQITYNSPITFFLVSYPNSANDLEAIMNLSQLGGLERMSLELLSDDPSEYVDLPPEDPAGDEDGQFANCVARWEEEGVDFGDFYYGSN